MSEKTEQPTSQKLRKAREEGQVAHSKDFTQTVLVLALFGYLLSDAPSIMRKLGELMLLPVGLLKMEFDHAVNVLITELLRASIEVMAPFLLIVIGLGLFVEMFQTNMLISFKALMPSGKKLNVGKNLKNIFSMKSLVEFLKSIVKIAILSTIVYFLISDALPTLMTLPQAGVLGVGVALAILLKAMMVRVAVGYAIIAAFDFIWQKKQHIKGLMMSKDEIKKEYKEAEGDANIKHQRKHLHKEMLEEGAVQKTKQASVVVTNPTHLAVAILYDKDKTPLPVVLAKGEGTTAARMVKAAREAGVPVLQNIPLARALTESAQIDQYIPSEFIEAVAGVLKMVQDMKFNEE
ncbi:MAG: type III secretion system export apparatus subunit SctU [Ramlibacter sp.]